jgi:hypothetical protein
MMGRASNEVAPSPHNQSNVPNQSSDPGRRLEEDQRARATANPCNIVPFKRPLKNVNNSYDDFSTMDRQYYETQASPLPGSCACHCTGHCQAGAALPPQLSFDLDRHMQPTPLVYNKLQTFLSYIKQGKRKRAKPSQHLVLDDSSDDQIALTIKLPEIEENLLDLNSMELPDGKKTLSPDFYEATIKPSTRSGLDTRLLVDMFMCITMFLVLIMMAPALAEAAPVPELMITMQT